MISQAGENSDVTELIKLQLDLWNTCGADYTIDNDVISVYKLLGGDFIYNDDNHVKSVLSDIGWIRAISAFYWYNKSPWRVDPSSYGKLCYHYYYHHHNCHLLIGKLSSAIRIYQYYLSQHNDDNDINLVQQPRSTYHDDNDSNDDAAFVKYNLNYQKQGLHTQHGLYSLLLSLFCNDDGNDDSSVIACLRSEGIMLMIIIIDIIIVIIIIKVILATP